MKIDELFERERLVRTAMANRASVMSLLLHQTVNHLELPQHKAHITPVRPAARPPTTPSTGSDRTVSANTGSSTVTVPGTGSSTATAASRDLTHEFTATDGEDEEVISSISHAVNVSLPVNSISPLPSHGRIPTIYDQEAIPTTIED